MAKAINQDTDQIVQRIAAEVAEKFLESEAMRTYETPPDGWGETKRFTLEFERCPETGDLECTTWGYDYSFIVLPRTWQDLIKYRANAQLGQTAPFPQSIVLRLYREIEYRANEALS